MSSWTKSLGKIFLESKLMVVVLIIMLFQIVITFESVNFITVYFSPQGDSKVCVCISNKKI